MVEERKKKQRKTFSTGKGGGGLAGLDAIIKQLPPAPTASERLRAAREAREAEIDKVMHEGAYKHVSAMRDLGYGWGVIANTLSDELNLKISANYLKSRFVEQPADVQPAPAPTARKVTKDTI